MAPRRRHAQQRTLVPFADHEPTIRRMAAEDARGIVSVEDEHGGLVIYRHGEPTHYRLNGEWFAAVAVPFQPSCDYARPPRQRVAGVEDLGLPANDSSGLDASADAPLLTLE